MKTAILLALFAALAFGCASEKSVVSAPSAQELAWAEKVRELDQQAKALQECA
jgi:hypothetical protein